jgi:hypothetical protein
MKSAVLTGAVLTCATFCATPTTAQTVQVGKDFSLTFHGMISATAFAQDQNFAFGNGQNAEFPIPPEATVDRWFGGADVRNTRLTLVIGGPKIGGDWKVGGTLEMDFFGGNNGTGPFAGQQPVPRLRLAFAEVTNGRTTIQVGQQWAPLWGNIPVSLSHIAFPLGWGSGGLIGWRYPGVFVGQKLTATDAPVAMDVQFAVMSGNWSGPNSTVDFGTAGNASWPQFELRFNVGGKAGEGTWSAYVVGHIDQKDLSGAGASEPDDKLTGSAVEVGAKVQLGPFLIQGNGYTGHAIGQQFASIIQFGRIQSEGGWAQVGYDLTKHWSVFGWFGVDSPKDSDTLPAFGDAARLKNIMYSGMLRWRSGPFAVGIEYLHSRLTSGPDEVETDGQQLALSGLFTF